MNLAQLTDEALALEVKAGSREAEAEILDRFSVKIRAIAREYPLPDSEIDDRIVTVQLAWIRAAKAFDPAHRVKFVTLAKKTAHNALISEWRSAHAGSRVPTWAKESLEDPDTEEPGAVDESFLSGLDLVDAEAHLLVKERKEERSILDLKPNKLLRVAVTEAAKEAGQDWVAVRDLLYPGLILIRLAPDPGTPQADEILIRAHLKFCEIRRHLIAGMLAGKSVWETAEELKVSRALVRMILEASVEDTPRPA